MALVCLLFVVITSAGFAEGEKVKTTKVVYEAPQKSVTYWISKRAVRLDFKGPRTDESLFVHPVRMGKLRKVHIYHNKEGGIEFTAEDLRFAMQEYQERQENKTDTMEKRMKFQKKRLKHALENRDDISEEKRKELKRNLRMARRISDSKKIREPDTMVFHPEHQIQWRKKKAQLGTLTAGKEEIATGVMLEESPILLRPEEREFFQAFQDFQTLNLMMHLARRGLQSTPQEINGKPITVGSFLEIDPRFTFKDFNLVEARLGSWKVTLEDWDYRDKSTSFLRPPDDYPTRDLGHYPYM